MCLRPRYMSKTPQLCMLDPIEDAAPSLVASLPWAALLVDMNGRIVCQNDAAVSLQEVSGATGGSHFADLYPSRFGALAGEPPWLTPQKVGYRRNVGDTVFHEQLWVGSIPDIGAYVLMVDDSDNVKAEQARMQTDRLASIGFMLAGVCHEVSNPLAATYSMVQLLQSQPELTEEMFRTGLQKIAANVKRVLEVSRTVYEFARVGEYRPTPVDLSIQEALEMLASDVRFEKLSVVHEPDYHGVIRADLIHLRQVFFNLVLNAAQAMGGEGEIRVTTHREQPDKVVVTVEDSGPGIPEAQLGKVFEPFFSTKPSGKGTGLGLAITRDIVRDHAGTISVENRAGGGACFRVVFSVEARQK